jgi:hypothetical protein
MDKFYLRYWKNFPEAGKIHIKTNYLAPKSANFTGQVLPDKFYRTSFTMGNLTQKVSIGDSLP